MFTLLGKTDGVVEVRVLCKLEPSGALCGEESD